MKKIGVMFLIILLLALPIIFAEDNNGDTDKVEKGYYCLKEKVNGNCDALSVEEQAFSLLALAYDSGLKGECKSALLGKSKNEECWPSSGCRLRDTALSILALNNIGYDTEKAESWLLSQKKTATDLIWYLEIDANEETKCEINGKTFNIAEDKKISGSSSCLTPSEGNYFLKIKNTCYDENFTVSCNKDFISTLLYKKGSTFHVSSETKSAPAEGTTQHTVNSFCFSQGGCNYEGSLWATLALAKTGNDISGFLPYLIAMADESENEKYFPYAFLYMITDYDDYFNLIIEEQKPSGYWQLSDSNKIFYDTALALLSLYGLDAEQIDSAKNYLLEVQGSNGCWRDNIRDTAFILYAAWPKSPAAEAGKIDYCEDYGYYCLAPDTCSADDTLKSYYCSGLSNICCKTQLAEQTCQEKGGIICTTEQQCSGATVKASDTSKCCLGSCIIQEVNECEQQELDCRFSCLKDEEGKPYSCGSGKVCCGTKLKKETSWWWIIILLVILIILVVLAIIFRNQLKIWLFRIKNKFRKGPAPSRVTRPGFPPGIPPTMARPRMIIPRARAPAAAGRQGPIRKFVSKTDKELEETLKKLREMSK